MNASPVVDIVNLSLNYDRQPALENVGLRVERGEIFGLVGADGAGKTTLLRVCAGQLTPDRGAVQILGGQAGDPRLRPRIAYMPQGFGLYRDLSIQENLDFFADLHGLAHDRARERGAGLLQRTGLAGFEKRRAGQLSGGMMQKLALSCALISDPALMLLDEPTTGVDPVSRRAFWKLIEGVRTQGLSIVYATANMDEAERCDRVGVLERGRMTRQGTPTQLAQVETATLIRIDGSQARRYRHTVRDLPGVDLVFPVGARLHVWLNAEATADSFNKRLAATAPALRAAAIEPTLQDALLRDMALQGVESR